ncbi:hypothetical protein ACHAWU_003630 [Discostella pseudostelligera]|uniref:Impact N-terminal domain-containing protein n=1 Tax=Discostella pseudostelligera TaxID=259834 RepID=A0ABD3MAT7_9STRA
MSTATAVVDAGRTRRRVQIPVLAFHPTSSLSKHRSAAISIWCSHNYNYRSRDKCWHTNNYSCVRHAATDRTSSTQLHFSSKSTSSTTAATTNQQQQPLKTLEGSDITYAAEEVIKKSRFIGYASHCSSWKEAQTILESVRKDHPKSRHVCFGFVSSSSSSSNISASFSSDQEKKDDDNEEVLLTTVGTERCSDDGEPTGTAGLPILTAIKGEGLSDVVCIVVRYFGGVKLGAGGLIRAYGSTARLVLRSAPTIQHIPQLSIRLSTMAANSGAIYAAAAKYNGVASDESYNDSGELMLTITCSEESGERMKQDIVDATRGGVTFYTKNYG